MPPGQQGPSTAAYRPTSLDFINLPNPIEPHAGSQRHPLNGTPRLEKARLESEESRRFQLLHDPVLTTPGSIASTAQRSGKRQKVSDSTPLDLPKLPVVNAAKRLRIPPTLSGLHQPPPDAGLLPSISVEKPQRPQPQQPANSITNAESSINPPAPIETSEQAAASDNPSQKPSRSKSQKASTRTSSRNKWTPEETRHLLTGVARFGIGTWTQILKCPQFKFNNRTALDLKDRFRVCCPDEYKSEKTHQKSHTPTRTSETTSSDKPKENEGNVSRGPPPQRFSEKELHEIGIHQPFTKTSRRKRTPFSKAEDAALLKGYRKHGNSWSSIRSDPSLCLSSRRPTDLRDRFRNRYPSIYAEAGHPPKQDKPLPTKTADTSSTSETHVDNDQEEVILSSNKANVESIMPLASHPQDTSSAESTIAARQSSKPKPPIPALFSLDDIFLGSSFGADDQVDQNEPIVLDRGILDWAANDASKAASADAARIGGIDPQVTLKLPRLATATQLPGAGLSAQPVASTTTSLPSLASMVSTGSGGIDHNEQLGLPSLVQWFGNTDSDGRSGLAANSFLSLEDLLS